MSGFGRARLEEKPFGGKDSLAKESCPVGRDKKLPSAGTPTVKRDGALPEPDRPPSSSPRGQVGIEPDQQENAREETSGGSRLGDSKLGDSKAQTKDQG